MEEDFNIEEVVMDSAAPVSNQFPGSISAIRKLTDGLKKSEFQRRNLTFGSIDLGSQNAICLCKNPLDDTTFYLGAGETNILYDRIKHTKKADCPIAQEMFRVLPYKEYLIDLNLKQVTIYDKTGKVVGKTKKGAIVE